MKSLTFLGRVCVCAFVGGMSYLCNLFVTSPDMCVMHLTMATWMPHFSHCGVLMFVTLFHDP